MKCFAPAAQRNATFIREILAEHLPKTGLVLEVGAGTGQHAARFAQAFDSLTWQPTDCDAHALASIEAYRAEAGLSNLRPPLHLDATESVWPVETADAVVSINMIHIAPWAAAEGLFQGAGRLLMPEAPLILYGPFFIDEVPTAESNLAFDARLRSQNSGWGIRRLKDLMKLAEAQDLEYRTRIAMPANNFSLIFKKRTP